MVFGRWGLLRMHQTQRFVSKQRFPLFIDAIVNGECVRFVDRTASNHCDVTPQFFKTPLKVCNIRSEAATTRIASARDTKSVNLNRAGRFVDFKIDPFCPSLSNTH